MNLFISSAWLAVGQADGVKILQAGVGTEVSRRLIGAARWRGRSSYLPTMVVARVGWVARTPARDGRRWAATPRRSPAVLHQGGDRPGRRIQRSFQHGMSGRRIWMRLPGRYCAGVRWPFRSNSRPAIRVLCGEEVKPLHIFRYSSFYPSAAMMSLPSSSNVGSSPTSSMGCECSKQEFRVIRSPRKAQFSYSG